MLPVVPTSCEDDFFIVLQSLFYVPIGFNFLRAILGKFFGFL